MLNSIYEFVKNVAFTPIMKPIYENVRVPFVNTVCKPIMETVKNCSWFGLFCEEVIKDTGNVRCMGKQFTEELCDLVGYKEVGSEVNPYFLAATGAAAATAALAGGYYWYHKRNASNKALADVKIEPKDDAPADSKIAKPH